MFKFSLILLVGTIFCCSVSAQENILSEDKKVPAITWEEDSFDLGQVKVGETRDLVYHFRNTGNDTLFIELVTACRCTSIDWPMEPVPPGKGGSIKVTFDSTDQTLGPVEKTVDVISNTDPIVVEAFFLVDVIE